VRLRLSGLLATGVFLVMVASDLLMLTSLDFSRAYRGFWSEALALPQGQVTLGYFLGELTIPFYCVGAWHLSLAIRPAGHWVSRLILVTSAYSAALFTVWHASFAFNRSILRTEGTGPGGPGPEALLAFTTYAEPLFRVGLAVAGMGLTAVLGMILAGRTLYPRWAAILLPAVFLVVASLLADLVPVSAAVVLRAGAWNCAGAAMFAASTAILWNRGAR